MNDSSLQQVKGLFSFAYGGMNGVGLGNSIQKYGYLTSRADRLYSSNRGRGTGYLGLPVYHDRLCALNWVTLNVYVMRITENVGACS